MIAKTSPVPALALIGFGEAASAFVTGWRSAVSLGATAYDIKTDAADEAVRAAKRQDYGALDVTGSDTPAAAVAGAKIVFSLVTADQTLAAAASAAPHLEPGALWFDCNSCAPGTKRRAAALIESRGARYVDTAVMAPVHPKLHKAPLLLSGPHAEDALAVVTALDMSARVVPGDVGTASSIKMVRSVMMKGLEALVLECVLSGRKAGVDEAVLDSLDATYPGFGWRQRAAYMMERVVTHGVRRAAEMREVALTVDELGLGGGMSRATVEWQQKIGDLKLSAAGVDATDYKAMADMILARLPQDD
jgi:3-hydroxyisobutyrate dehydrogenase-like beta-hydroxyacid dehydrogenase